MYSENVGGSIMVEETQQVNQLFTWVMYVIDSSCMTPLEHFQTSTLLTPELRSMCVKYTKENDFDGAPKVGTLSEALKHAFYWDSTIEGHVFWEKICALTLAKGKVVVVKV